MQHSSHTIVCSPTRDTEMTHQPQGKEVTEKQREFGIEKERGKGEDRLKDRKEGERFVYATVCLTAALTHNRTPLTQSVRARVNLPVHICVCLFVCLD